MRAIQDATLELYSHRDVDTFRRSVSGIFLRLIPADYFSLGDGRIDLERRSARILNIWESRPLRQGAMLEALERNLFDHPFTQYALSTGLRGALMLSDFLTLPQLRATRLYREALQPCDIGRLISIGSMSGPGLASISIARPERDRDFTERDRRVLEVIRPHFDQARNNLERESMRRATHSKSLHASGITPRESEVALWLAQGKTNPEIATILRTPVRTIEKHVEHILHKLGVDNRSAAALYVAEIIGA
jgi:DNA-binding CsgD family transcriptional regulator